MEIYLIEFWFVLIAHVIFPCISFISRLLKTSMTGLQARVSSQCLLHIFLSVNFAFTSHNDLLRTSLDVFLWWLINDVTSKI